MGGTLMESFGDLGRGMVSLINGLIFRIHILSHETVWIAIFASWSTLLLEEGVVSVGASNFDGYAANVDISVRTTAPSMWGMRLRSLTLIYFCWLLSCQDVVQKL